MWLWALELFKAAERATAQVYTPTPLLPNFTHQLHLPPSLHPFSHSSSSPVRTVTNCVLHQLTDLLTAEVHLSAKGDSLKENYQGKRERFCISNSLPMSEEEALLGFPFDDLE